MQIKNSLYQGHWSGVRTKKQKNLLFHGLFFCFLQATLIITGLKTRQVVEGLL
jgi:hypothetical protein